MQSAHSNAMEPQNYNPYEQQLLLEYESCLEKGQSRLSETGLKSLCNKLELEDGEKLIFSLLDQASEGCSISFDEFRSGLVNFLNESRENEVSLHKNKVCDDSSPLAMLDGQCSPQTSARLKQFYANSNTTNTANSSLDRSHDDSPIPKQTLEQMFHKLDTNHDGLITFDEFVLFFHNGRNQGHQLDTMWDDRPPEDSNCRKNTLNMLGPDHTGFIQNRTVINLWQMAGVSDPSSLLRDLNFPNVDINLTELVSVLNEELQSLQHEPKDAVITTTHFNLLRGTLVLYQEEVRSINTMIDQLTQERDKLRVDVLEANERANLLAQEIDENHAKLEKSRQDQIKQLDVKHLEIIKDLTNQYNCDRETHIAKIKSLNEQLQHLQHEDQTIRVKLVEALNENQNLEIENQKLAEQIAKLKMSNNQLLMQMQVLSAEHDEADQNNERENEQIISLVERIKGLQVESALLRDQNDELMTELEVMKSRVGDNKAKHLTASASSSDSEECSVTDYESLDKQVPELKNTNRQPDDISYSPTIASVMNDLRRITFDERLNTCEVDCPFKHSVLQIITELDPDVWESIAHKSNIQLGNKEDECEERLSESLRDFVVPKCNKSRLSTTFSHSDEVISTVDACTKFRNSSLRDYPPRKDDNASQDQSRGEQDKNSISKKTVDVVDGVDLESIQKDKERLSVQLKELETKHLNEKKQLTDQIAMLESDLESLRIEYDQCEDYWAAKIEEESQLMEQEQKVTDEKLAELISKIAEYEEQFSINDKRNDRLSPIEEKFHLEQQYADLEDQYEDLKNQTQNIIAEKESQLIELHDKLEASKVIKVDCQVQVPETDNTKCMRKVSLPVLPNELPCSISNTNQAISNSTHYGSNPKSFEFGKLNKIAEHSIDDNKALVPSKMTGRGCCCQQNEAHSSGDEMSRLQKVQRMLQKKAHNTNLECSSLMKQKEYLVREIMKLQNIKSSQSYSGIPSQVTKVDMNVIKDLIVKLQVVEKKKKSLQVNLKHQKQLTEKVLEFTWKQHCNEFADLQHVLKETQESLKHQIKINSMQIEKLAKSDMLLKDLYIENAHLKQTVENLGQRCHVLTHLSTESTSV